LGWPTHNDDVDHAGELKQSLTGRIMFLDACRIVVNKIFFKFSGAKESVYIFSTIGGKLGLAFIEPWGRIGSGVMELIASILLLWPRTVVYGAALSMGVISAAIVFHLTWLGVALTAVDDHGELFALALVVFVCSAAVSFLHRSELPGFGAWLPQRRTA